MALHREYSLANGIEPAKYRGIFQYSDQYMQSIEGESYKFTKFVKKGRESGNG